MLPHKLCLYLFIYKLILNIYILAYISYYLDLGAGRAPGEAVHKIYPRADIKAHMLFFCNFATTNFLFISYEVGLLVLYLYSYNTCTHIRLQICIYRVSVLLTFLRYCFYRCST